MTPATVTVTGPVIAFGGTFTMICESLQLLAVATTPPKATLLLLCVAPKPLPLMVTDVPTTPVAGEMLVIVGGGDTVKGIELLTMPLLLTVTGPLVALYGMITWICVSLQHAYQGFCRHVPATLAVTPLIETTPF